MRAKVMIWSLEKLLALALVAHTDNSAVHVGGVTGRSYF